MEFLQTPNLPDSDVALVAVSGTYQTIINALNKLEIDVIKIRSCHKLSKPICSHADMVVHHLGGNHIVVLNGEEYLKNQLAQNGFDVVSSSAYASEIYPHDVILNAARVGNKIIAKEDALDKTIIQYCKCNNLKIISVKQGYTKCSTVVINENSIITADKSIAEASRKTGIDVLQIKTGDVQLKGYEYGFLGGACGMIGKNLIAFTGNIMLHPDYIEIKKFCSKKNVNMISLSNSALIDIGGIIPIRLK